MIFDTKVEKMSDTYAYVARFHLDAQTRVSSLFHARSMAELIDWANTHQMTLGRVTAGTNCYQPEHGDGSPLSEQELGRLPQYHVVDNRGHVIEGLTLGMRVRGALG